MILPDEGAFACEFIDVSFMTGWLVRYGFSHVDYRVDRTPGGNLSGAGRLFAEGKLGMKAAKSA
jgi:hypothetical protein